MMYAFEARDPEGVKHTGRLQAQSEHQVALHLRQKKMIPIKIKKMGWWQKSMYYLQDFLSRYLPITKNTRLIILFEINTLLKNNISLQSALLQISEQTSIKRVKTALVKIHDRLANGSTLAESFSEFENIFPPVFISYLSLAERGVPIATVFNMVVELQSRMRKKSILKNLILPHLPLLITNGIALWLITYLTYYDFPWLLNQLNLLRAKTTPGLIETAQTAVFLAHNWLTILIAGGIALVSFLFLLRRPFVQHAWHVVLLKIPVVRRWQLIFDAYNCISCLLVALRAQLTFQDALLLSAATLHNTALKPYFIHALDLLQKGESIKRALMPLPLFSKTEKALLNTAQSSEQLEQACSLLENIYSSREQANLVATSQAMRLLLYITLFTMVFGFLSLYGALIMAYRRA